MINWTIREIEVFLSLADTLSFRRTAERMHLSQPAVSGVVARVLVQEHRLYPAVLRRFASGHRTPLVL